VKSKQALIPVPGRKIAPYVQVMSIESKRGEGAAEELGGTIKKVAGKVLGNEQMEAEGRAKEAAGEAKQEAAKAVGRTEGKIQEVVGAVKNRIGQVIDNEQMAAEGKVKEIKGEAKQKANENRCSSTQLKSPRARASWKVLRSGIAGQGYLDDLAHQLGV